MIFPILFSANHAIELYLTSILWNINVISNSNNKIEGKHNIKQLYSMVCSRISAFYNRIGKDFISETKIVNKYIEELYARIESEHLDSENRIDFSRYPMDEQYNNHFYLETYDNIIIDLAYCKEVFSKIEESLECASSYLSFIVEELNQRESDSR
jgi:hypothetical protein